jgi:predicted permease
MRNLSLNLRYSLRALRKSFAISAIVILSIGLGIGLNTAIFSLMNAVLLRAAPGVQDPSHLVEVYTGYRSGVSFGAVSYPDYKDWRDRSSAFSGLLASTLVPANLNRDHRNEVISGALVSGNYFSVLGVKPFLGRLFTSSEDDESGAARVVVLSYGLWKNYFGGDPTVIGQNITINGSSFNIVGVAPENFEGANIGLAVNIWCPLTMQSVFIPTTDRLKSRGMRWLDVVGRLKPGISRQQAQHGTQITAAELTREFPATNRDAGIHIVGFGEGPIGVQSYVLPVVKLLMVVVLLVLLLACFNVANLLLSRVFSRNGEMAIRLATGASRANIIELLLSESVVLSLCAGMVALLIGYQGIRLIEVFLPKTSVPISLGLGIDLNVVLFTLGLSLVAGVLIGLLPALRAAKVDILPMLRSEGYFQSYTKSKVQHGLVIAQIAISVVLVVGAGLVLRSAQFVHKVDPGFKTDHLILASVEPGFAGYGADKGMVFYQRVLERLRTLPGVRSASLAQTAPLEFAGDQQMGVYIEGKEIFGSNKFSIDYNVVGSSYFQTMEIPLVAGREFTEQDRADTAGVVVVNEAFARRFWPNQDALGKRISTVGPEGPYFQIVGVAKNSKYYSMLEQPFPFLFFPLYQKYNSGMVLHLSTVTAPESYSKVVQQETQLLDPAVPVFRLRTMKEQQDVSLIVFRTAAVFLGLLGSLAMVLACIGLYGMMAYSTAKRKPEMAIRMAVGAQRHHVLSLIVREGMMLILIGVAAGLAMAFAAGHLLAAFLYGVSPTDPLTIGVVSFILVSVALSATIFPAWKATKANPMDALRSS